MSTLPGAPPAPQRTPECAGPSIHQPARRLQLGCYYCPGSGARGLTAPRSSAPSPSPQSAGPSLGDPRSPKGSAPPSPVGVLLLPNGCMQPGCQPGPCLSLPLSTPPASPACTPRFLQGPQPGPSVHPSGSPPPARARPWARAGASFPAPSPSARREERRGGGNTHKQPSSIGNRCTYTSAGSRDGSRTAAAAQQSAAQPGGRGGGGSRLLPGTSPRC